MRVSVVFCVVLLFFVYVCDVVFFAVVVPFLFALPCLCCRFVWFFLFSFLSFSFSFSFLILRFAFVSLFICACVCACSIGVRGVELTVVFCSLCC